MKNVIFSITRHSHPFYLKTPGLISFLKLIGFPSTITFVSKLIPQPPLFLLLQFLSFFLSLLVARPVFGIPPPHTHTHFRFSFSLSHLLFIGFQYQILYSRCLYSRFSFILFFFSSSSILLGFNHLLLPGNCESFMLGLG